MAQNAKQWAQSMADSARRAVKKAGITTFTDSKDGRPKFGALKRRKLR